MQKITVQINDEKSIDIVGIKAKQLGILLNKFRDLTKRAKDDKEIAAALSGLSYLFRDDKNSAVLIQLIPQVLATFYDEFMDMMTELFPLTREEVDDMELDKLVEIIGALVSLTDLPKVADLLKKYLILQK